jgi:hypothetical protein
MSEKPHIVKDGKDWVVCRSRLNIGIVVRARKLGTLVSNWGLISRLHARRRSGHAVDLTGV